MYLYVCMYVCMYATSSHTCVCLHTAIADKLAAEDQQRAKLEKAKIVNMLLRKAQARAAEQSTVTEIECVVYQYLIL
jgi:hypothetical protein